MNRIERDIISNNIENIIPFMYAVDNVIHCLHKRGVFNSYLVEELRVIGDEEERIRMMFKCITTRGPAAFEHLISALVETQHSNLAINLLKERFTDRMDKDYVGIDVFKSERRYDINQREDEMPVYKMGSRPKGYALIINIHDFHSDYNNMDFLKADDPIKNSGSQSRFGSYRDVANMYLLLTQLGYEVTIKYDLIKKKFIQEVKDFRNKPEHKEVDSCMVVIMSHGKEDRNGVFQILTYDEQTVSYRRIVDEFNSINCPALKSKPKIFIFQFCRGDGFDQGVNRDDNKDNIILMSSEVNTNFVSVSNSKSGSLSQQMLKTAAESSLFQLDVYKSEYDSTLKDGENFELQSSHQDIYILYANVEGKVSKRDVINGSHLIQCICKVFMEHAKDSDFISMIAKVQSLLDERVDPKFGAQTAWTEGCMLKKIYFHPGLYYDDNICYTNNDSQL